MKKTFIAFLIAILGITLFGFNPQQAKAADPTVTSLAISPTTASLQAGQSTIFTLTAILSDSSVVTATELATWSPNGGGFTGIPGQRGTYTALAQGSWLLQASYGGITASASVVISHGTLSHLNLLPKTANLTADGLLPLRLFGVDAQGNAWDVLDAATFTVDDPLATVSAAGFAPHSAGTWTITATYGGYQASLPVTITPGMLASIQLTPSTIPTLNVNDTTTVEATPTDAKGNPVQKPLQWKTTNPDVATIDAKGKVTARSAGQTNLVVESEGVSVAQPIVVAPVDAGRVAPTDDILAVARPVTRTPQVAAEEIDRTPTTTNEEANLTPGTTTLVTTCSNLPHPWIIVLILLQAVILAAYFVWLQRKKLALWWLFPALLTVAALITYRATICQGEYLWWPWTALGLAIVFSSVYYQRQDNVDTAPPAEKPPSQGPTF